MTGQENSFWHKADCRYALLMFADLLLGAIVTLLPPRMREHWLSRSTVPTPLSAGISGALQSIGALAVLIGRYYSFMQDRLAAYSGSLQKSTEYVPPTAYYGMTVFSLVEYIIHPVTLLAIYFCIEGTARIVVALVGGEALGTLPLYAVQWTVDAVNRRRAEAELGPRVPDKVRKLTEEEHAMVDYELVIMSCRPKQWHSLKTISFEDQLWELAGTMQGDPPHRFVYLLRRSPAHKIVRGLEQYDPAAVLESK